MSRREQIPPFLSPGSSGGKRWRSARGWNAGQLALLPPALRREGVRSWGVPRCPRRVSSWGSSGHFLSILTLTKLGPLLLRSSPSVAIVSKIRLSGFLAPPPHL